MQASSHYRMSLLQSSELRLLFDEFDRNRYGLLDLHELQTILKPVGVDAGIEELNKIAGTSSIDFKEFEALCNQRASEDAGGDDHDASIELMEAFKVYDEDGNGFISSEEVERVLVKMGLWKDGDGDCSKMIWKFDANNDGQLDFQEFKDMILLRTLS